MVTDLLRLMNVYERARVFSRMCDLFHVDRLTITSPLGRITGDFHDQAVFLPFALQTVWETELVTMFQDFFRAAGGTYIDIGANIGLMTIPIAQNPLVQCFAFEPEPRNFRYLSANVAENCPHRNVELTQKALFHKTDCLEFELSPNNMGDHRIRLSPGEGQWEEQKWNTIRVDAVPLDTFPLTVRCPTAVKIDVQGAEPFVLEGGTRVLSEAGLLCIEFSPYLSRRMSADLRIIGHFLANHFARGMLAKAGEPRSVSWQPIGSLVEQLDALCEREWGPADYWDIAAAKAEVAAGTPLE